MTDLIYYFNTTENATVEVNGHSLSEVETLDVVIYVIIGKYTCAIILFIFISEAKWLKYAEKRIKVIESNEAHLCTEYKHTTYKIHTYWIL